MTRSERVQQAIALLQKEIDEVRAHLLKLNGEVEDYIATFDDASNEVVIAAARADHRYYRTIQFPLQPSASECLSALKQWRERDLDVDVVRKRLYRLRKAIGWLEGKEEDGE